MGEQTGSANVEMVVGGRYALRSRLDGGGMADVYLAEDLALRRLVAVKILKPELAADQDLLERFRIEAQAAAQLNHPNIVAVYDRGPTEDSAYIVMEYVCGETVRQRIRRDGRFLPEEAMRVAIAVLAALEAAHERHIVHRDVTSSNVMIDERGQVKVADFGIARIGAPGLTRTGTVLGTSSYVSPEQAQGRRADERSDLYSLGVVLFEMLAGRLPFTGDSDVAIALQHVSAAPPDPRAFAPELPESLAAVAGKALSKEPDDRYQSAMEFAAALKRVRAPVPVTSHAAPRPATAVTAPVAGPAVTPPAPTVPEALTAAVAGGGGDAPPVASAPAEPAPAFAPKRHRPRRWLALLLSLAVLGGGVWALFALVLPSGASVPGVVGRTQADAVAMIEAQGLKPVVQKVWADGADAGSVARQRPVPGTSVEDGTKVNVWVSRGPLHIPAPDLIGSGSSVARKTLDSQALKGTRRKAVSESVAEGDVMRQEPAAGVTVTRGDMITYWVSSGPPLIQVPDVVGIPSNDAVTILKEAGFVASIDFVLGWGVYPGDVVAQNPAAGERLQKGDEVIIEVALL